MDAGQIILEVSCKLMTKDLGYSVSSYYVPHKKMTLSAEVRQGLGDCIFGY